MPVITSIKQQKDLNRVNVYLDGKFGFGIDLENFVKLNLRVEQELSGREIDKIIKKSEFQKTYMKFLKFSMLRPRSEKELTDWLQRKKVPKNLYRKLFDRLKRLKLVNDYEFAQWWVAQRMQFRPKSVLELSSELYKKGIDKNIISKVLEKSDINEEKIIIKLMNKNKWRFQRYDSQTRKKKISDYLMRKGFKWEVVKKLL